MITSWSCVTWKYLTPTLLPCSKRVVSKLAGRVWLNMAGLFWKEANGENGRNKPEPPQQPSTFLLPPKVRQAWTQKQCRLLRRLLPVISHLHQARILHTARADRTLPKWNCCLPVNWIIELHHIRCPAN